MISKNDLIMIEAFRWDKYGISGCAIWDIGDYHLWITYDYINGWVVVAKNWIDGGMKEYSPRSRKELYEIFDKIRAKSTK